MPFLGVFLGMVYCPFVLAVVPAITKIVSLTVRKHVHSTGEMSTVSAASFNKLDLLTAISNSEPCRCSNTLCSAG